MWRLQKSEILQGEPAGERPRKELQFESKGRLLAEFPLSGGQCFYTKAFNWLDEGDPLYSKSTDENINLISKIPSQKHLE